MKKITILLSLLTILSISAFAQSYYFGLKGGPSIGFQQWDGIDRNALLRWHGSVFIESMAEVGEIGLFAQAGYHKKGSSIGGGLATGINGNPIRLSGQAFVFNNVDLVVGVKQRLDFSMMGSKNAFYTFGLRGDYTIDTNLEQYQDFNRGFLPFPEFVRKWNYGASISGGFEFDFMEYIGGIFEISIHPDFSFQYQQPAIPNVRNPWTGAFQTLNERTIRNVTLEISVGFRFLREIEYID